jgi:hypothetical protein
VTLDLNVDYSEVVVDQDDVQFVVSSLLEVVPLSV